MSHVSLVYGLPCLAIGILLVWFARRLADWIAASSARLLSFIPRRHARGLTPEQALENWKNSPLRFFETLWVWYVRVFGLVCVVMGVFLLLPR